MHGMSKSRNHLTPEDVFDGLLLQRTVLRRDQQLAEWANSQ